MKIQYEEAEYLYVKNRAITGKQDLNTSNIEHEIENLIANMNVTDDEKQLAFIRLYNKYVRSEEKH